MYIPGCPPMSFLVESLLGTIIGKESEYHEDEFWEEADELYRDGEE